MLARCTEGAVFDFKALSELGEFSGDLLCDLRIGAIRAKDVRDTPRQRTTNSEGVRDTHGILPP